jgi:methylase of polypeptide subunit release factors
MVSEAPVIHWQDAAGAHQAKWRSEKGSAPPRRVIVADDTITADHAYRVACEGTALLWQGDFQAARQLLLALARRADAKSRTPSPSTKSAALPISDAFHRHRLAQSQRARTLGMLLLPLAGDYTIPLRRAPDLRLACAEVYGELGEAAEAAEDSVVSLRELLGLIGAHEWRKKGVEVAALKARVHPHYGVFAPIRAEYVGLLAAASFTGTLARAFDIGTGTGVLAAVLAQRGVPNVIATDNDGRAIACAKENIARLKLDVQVTVVNANLFPEGRAQLIVCNPPWIPARPSSPIEGAIYDPESRMLRGFLDGLAAHLEPNGEGWLILSDIAEHLGLRSRAMLLDYIEGAGLLVADRHDTHPTHPRAADPSDPLHAARAAEVTSLWRLRAK